MSREKPNYRDTLEALTQRTDGRLIITLAEAAELLGVDRRRLSGIPTVKAGRSKMVSVAYLARMLS